MLFLLIFDHSVCRSRIDTNRYMGGKKGVGACAASKVLDMKRRHTATYLGSPTSVDKNI